MKASPVSEAEHGYLLSPSALTSLLSSLVNILPPTDQFLTGHLSSLSFFLSFLKIQSYCDRAPNLFQAGELRHRLASPSQ